jgi:hypothetical protein
MAEPTDDTPDEQIISGYAAYFEPLRPPDELTAEADELIEKAAAAEPRLAESLQRSALERLVDAFLVDRRGHAESFSAAHLLGREILQRFGCPFTFDAEREVWILRCGVLALHSRLATSPGGSTIGECSICGAADFECDHVNGEVYDGKRCHRIITRFDLREISVTPRPHDPRCYRATNRRASPSARTVFGLPTARTAPSLASTQPQTRSCPPFPSAANHPLSPPAPGRSGWPTAAMRRSTASTPKPVGSRRHFASGAAPMGSPSRPAGSG